MWAITAEMLTFRRAAGTLLKEEILRYLKGLNPDAISFESTQSSFSNG